MAHYIRITVCDSCGDATLIYRGSAGAAVVAAEESGVIPVDHVVEGICTALRARGAARVMVGTCWVCVCDKHVLRDDVVGDGS